MVNVDSYQPITNFEKWYWIFLIFYVTASIQPKPARKILVVKF